MTIAALFLYPRNELIPDPDPLTETVSRDDQSHCLKTIESPLSRNLTDVDEECHWSRDHRERETHAVSSVPKPDDCPKFDRCNAPICPLDAQMLERVLDWNEPTCFYLRLFAKQGLEGLFSTSVPRQVAKRVAEAYPILIARYAPIKRSLARAATSPEKGFLTQRGKGGHDLKE